MRNTLSLQIAFLAFLTFAIVATVRWPDARFPRLYGGPYTGEHADLMASISAVDAHGVTPPTEPGYRDYLYNRATWLPDPVRLLFATPSDNRDYHIRAGRTAGSNCGTFDGNPPAEYEIKLGPMFGDRRTYFISDGRHVWTDGRSVRSIADRARFAQVWDDVCGAPGYAPRLTYVERLDLDMQRWHSLGTPAPQAVPGLKLTNPFLGGPFGRPKAPGRIP